MHRAFKLIALLSLALVVAPAANAANWGPGFLYRSHPVGVFFGINDDATIHAALGFSKVDVDGPLFQDYESEFGLAGALLWDMVGGDNWGFGIAPGGRWTLLSPEDGDSDNQFLLSAALMGHWDPADMLSFWFGHGVNIHIFSPGAPNADSTTDFFTNGNNIADVGFTVWIP
jgi:hypothetical protein